MKKWVHLLLKHLQELTSRWGRCTRALQCAVAGRQLLPGGTGPLPLEEEFQDVLFLELLVVPNSHLGHNWVIFDFFFLSWFLCIFFYLNLLLINVLFYIVNTWMTLNDWFECVTPSLTALHLCTHYTPQSTLHCSIFPLMGILCCFAVLRESGRTDLGRYLFQVTHPVCFKHLHDHTLVLCVCASDIACLKSNLW